MTLEQRLSALASAVGADIKSLFASRDPVIDFTVPLILSTEWSSTEIKGSSLATGTYIVQIYANDTSNGGTNANEYYSGVMSWYAGDTNGEEEDEIVLHRAGASTDGNIYVRTRRTLSSDPDNLVLEVRSNIPTVATNNYVFKFRKLI